MSPLADTIFVPFFKLRRIHRIAVPLQCLHTLPCRHAPHAHSLVVTRRYDIRAIRAKLRRSHPMLCPSNVCTHSPVATLHTRTVLSPLADTIFVPSGLNCADITPLLCPSNVCTHSPVATLHTRTVLSPLADTIFVPSGLNCADLTARLCPSNVCTHSPVATLHTRTVWSPLADTIFVPSGLNCAEFTHRCAPPMSAHTPLSPRSTRAQSCPHSPIRYSCHPG